MFQLIPLPYKLGAAALVLAALLGWGLHLKHTWQEEAYNNGKADQQLVSSAELAKQTQIAAEQFKQLQGIIEGYKADQAASHQREAMLVQAISNLKIQQSQASQQVAALPDYTAVKADLEKKAGGSIEDYRTLQRIDDAYTQVPLIRDEVANLGRRIAELEGREASLKNQVAATEKQRDDLKAQYNAVITDNTHLRDLLNRPKRRAWCLWLCKTKDKLVLPATIQ